MSDINKPLLVRYLETRGWTENVYYYPSKEMIRIVARDIPWEGLRKVKSEGWSFDDQSMRIRPANHFQIRRENDES